MLKPPLKVDYLIWYFGLASDLARALQLSAKEVRGWGEYLPKKYEDKVMEIVESDAIEKIK